MARTRARLDAGHAGLEPPITLPGGAVSCARCGRWGSTDVLDEIEARSVSVADDGRGVPPGRPPPVPTGARGAGGDPVHGGVGPGLVICKGWWRRTGTHPGRERRGALRHPRSPLTGPVAEAAAHGDAATRVRNRSDAPARHPSANAHPCGRRRPADAARRPRTQATGGPRTAGRA